MSISSLPPSSLLYREWLREGGKRTMPREINPASSFEPRLRRGRQGKILLPLWPASSGLSTGKKFLFLSSSWAREKLDACCCRPGSLLLSLLSLCFPPPPKQKSLFLQFLPPSRSPSPSCRQGRVFFEDGVGGSWKWEKERKGKAFHFFPEGKQSLGERVGKRLLGLAQPTPFPLFPFYAIRPQKKKRTIGERLVSFLSFLPPMLRSRECDFPKERRISFPGGRTKIFLATQSSLAHEEEKTFCFKKEKVWKKILKELAVMAPDLLFSQLCSPGKWEDEGSSSSSVHALPPPPPTVLRPALIRIGSERKGPTPSSLPSHK